MKSTTRRLTRTLQNMRPRHNVLYDGDSSDVSKFVTDPNNIRRFQVRVDHTLVMGMLHSAADRGD